MAVRKVVKLGDRERVVAKFRELGNELVLQIERGEHPHLIIPVRSLSNIEYNAESGILMLKGKTGKRYLFNVAHTRRFMQTLIVAAKILEHLKENKHPTLREIYYELKNRIPGTNENFVEDQKESNIAIEDLEVILGIARDDMNIEADPRGYMMGDVVIEQGGREANIKDMPGRWGLPISTSVTDMVIKELSADYVLVVETGALYLRLVEENYWKKNNCILITPKGQSARSVRVVIKRLRDEFNLPIIVFTDGDPWGWYIYSVIKRGAIKTAYISEELATPDAKFVGMTMDDVEKYDLKHVTEPLKDVDIKRAQEEMKYPWFQHPDWQRQFKKALQWKVRIEQQALANKGLDFAAKQYLPEKIENKEFLP